MSQNYLKPVPAEEEPPLTKDEELSVVVEHLDQIEEKEAQAAADETAEPEDLEGEEGTPIDPRLQVIIFDGLKFHQQYSRMRNTRNSLAGKRRKLRPPKAMTAGMGGGSGGSRTDQKNAYAMAMKSQKTDDWVTAIAGRLSVD